MKTRVFRLGADPASAAPGTPPYFVIWCTHSWSNSKELDLKYLMIPDTQCTNTWRVTVSFDSWHHGNNTWRFDCFVWKRVWKLMKSGNFIGLVCLIIKLSSSLVEYEEINNFCFSFYFWKSGGLTMHRPTCISKLENHCCWIIGL